MVSQWAVPSQNRYLTTREMKVACRATGLQVRVDHLHVHNTNVNHMKGWEAECANPQILPKLENTLYRSCWIFKIFAICMFVFTSFSSVSGYFQYLIWVGPLCFWVLHISHTDLIRSLVSSAVSALHGIAPGDAEPPPDHHTGSGLFRTLHCKAAELEAECRSHGIEQPRKILKTGRSGISASHTRDTSVVCNVQFCPYQQTQMSTEQYNIVTQMQGWLSRASQNDQEMGWQQRDVCRLALMQEEVGWTGFDTRIELMTERP